MRPHLMGLAYRMLGSVADAEDAVQDTFLKWQKASKPEIRNHEAWMTTACTNRCLDILKSAHRQRVDYVGPWLPEPLQTETAVGPEDEIERSQSLTTAFLLVMERLTPKERAAFLLREVFGKPYSEVANTLELTEAACRQLVSRAKRFVREDTPRSAPTRDQQASFMAAFHNALNTGSVEELGGLLAQSIQLRTDGGGKATAIRRVLEGKADVGKFVTQALGRLWGAARLKPCEINGYRGLLILEGDTIAAAMSLGYTEEGLVDQIFIIRNPEKLARLERSAVHDPKTGSLRLN